MKNMCTFKCYHTFYHYFSFTFFIALLLVTGAASTIAASNKPPVAGSGNCLGFNGVNQYVDVGTKAVIPARKPVSWTIEFWIRPASPTDSSYIFQQGTLSNDSFQLGVYWLANRLQFAFSPSGLARADTATGTIANNTWSHIAEVATAINDSTYSFNVYVNGVPSGGPTDTKTKTFKSRTFIGGDTTNTRGFRGNIDEMRIWSTARTQQQIQNSMYGFVPHNETGLTACWHMDEFSGNLLADLSPTAAAGTCKNMVDTNRNPYSPLQSRVTQGVTAFWHGAGYDPEDATLAITMLTNPAKGAVTTAANRMTYTPNVNVSGYDFYDYSVSDGVTLDTFRVSVAIANPPVIKTHPVKTQSILQGSRATLWAVTESYPKAAFRWMKWSGSSWDSIPQLLNATADDSLFVIASMTAADTGMYRVAVSNSTGKVTSDTARLGIYAQPIITLQPRDTVIVPGNPAAVSLVANGFNLTYQWQKKSAGIWVSIPSARSALYSFTPGTADTEYHHCIVTSGPLSVTSDSARVLFKIAPRITSLFSRDTVLRTGMPFRLTATAEGTPTPTLSWYTRKTPLETPVLFSNNAQLSIDTLKKAHHGYYSVTATNSVASTTSPDIFVRVLDPVTITTDLPPRYYTPEGGTATLSIATAGDDSLHYQWFANNQPVGQSITTITIPNVSAAMNGTIYTCVAWNSFLGTLLGRDTSVQCTLRISQVYNPFEMSASKLSRDSISIKIWSRNPEIKNFPSEATPLTPKPWADSLWVMHNPKGFTTNPSLSTVTLVSTASIKTTSPDTTRLRIKVLPLTPPPDSSYYFNYTLKWHIPGQTDTILSPYFPSSTVLMIDTTIPANPLWAQGFYRQRTDTVLLVLDSIHNLRPAIDSIVTIQCSRDKLFSSTLFEKTIKAATLAGSGKKTDTLVIPSIATLPIPFDTLFLRWTVINRSGVAGITKYSEFTIGWNPPVFMGTFGIDSCANASQLIVDRTLNETGTIDSVRILFDTSRSAVLMGSSTINLSQVRSIKVAPLVTRDTIKGLSSYTRYFAWIQIYKDQMWSAISARGMDSAFTAHADTIEIANGIIVDSIRFDTLSNTFTTHWHVDTTLFIAGKKYESSYTVNLDSAAMVSAKPGDWREIRTSVNQTTVNLGRSIWFDTTFIVGMWIQATDIATGKISKPSPPTSNATGRGTTPRFTWQYISFSTAKCPDTLFVANNRITIQTATGKPFDYFDTLFSYRRTQPLPAGFVHIGGISFRFAKINPEVFTMRMGVRYDTLPPGIKKENCRLYREINGALCLMYGSYESQGRVWASIGKNEINKPFLILADTMKPRITTTPYEDPIEQQATTVTTRFTITDNNANNRYLFRYGTGNESLPYAFTDTLKPGKDTIICTITNAERVAHPFFGMRAQLLVSDGIHSDSVNISRSVINTRGESYLLPRLSWVPVRSALDIKTNSIDSLLSRSSTETTPWSYDKTRQRIFRYYTLPGNDTSGWSEYQPQKNADFALTRGRVLWIKSASDFQMQFGPSTTPSLKEATTIVLRPNEWTDVANPYSFPILLRDILAASGPRVTDSITIYQWKQDGTSYDAQRIFLGALTPVSQVKDTFYAQQHHDAYTIFNNSASLCTLVIPPRCIAFGGYTAPDETKNNPAHRELSLKWRESAAASYKSITCFADDRHPDTQRFGPIPPSMNLLRGGMTNPGNTSLSDFCIQNIADAPGLMFTCAFVNNDAVARQIDYVPQLDGMVPEGFSVAVINPATGTFEPVSEQTASIGSGERFERVVAAGTQDYLNQVLAGLATFPLRLLSMYPNPFRGNITLHYSLPEGIAEVHFRVYDLRGKLLWNETVQQRLRKGLHRFTYRGTIGNAPGAHLPSGMYIVHLEAVDTKGNILVGGSKKMNCIR